VECQLRVCELLYHCEAIPEGLLVVLVRAAREEGGVDAQTRQYLVEVGGPKRRSGVGAWSVCDGWCMYVYVQVLHHRRQALSPSRYMAVLLELLELPKGTSRAHAMAMAEAAAWALKRLRKEAQGGCPLLGMLGPGLDALLGRGVDRRPAMMLLGSVWGDETLLPPSLVQRVAEEVARPDEEAGLELAEEKAALLVRHQDQDGALAAVLVALAKTGEGGEKGLGQVGRVLRCPGLRWRAQGLDQPLRDLRASLETKSGPTVVGILADLTLISQQRSHKA
jgi:hypothetical protein